MFSHNSSNMHTLPGAMTLPWNSMDKLSIHGVSEGENVAVLLWKTKPAGTHWVRFGTSIYVYMHTYIYNMPVGRMLGIHLEYGGGSKPITT